MAYTTDQIANIFRLVNLPVPNQERLQRIATDGRSATEIRDALIAFRANQAGVSTEQMMQTILRETFTNAGVNIATGNETEPERLARIAAEVLSGDRTLGEVTATINSFSGNPSAPSGPTSPSTPTPPSAPDAPDIPDPTPDPGTDPGTPTPIDYRAQVRALYPYLPDQLVNIFANAWSESGDPILALAQTRASNAYDSFFPGIKREDGSLRMSEQEWFATREAYSRLFQEYGLNPANFSGRFTSLMKLSVSASELAARLGAVYEEIVNDIPQVREYYARVNGIELSDQAIFASAIDPDIGQAILDRRISVASIGGEALARGFDVNEPFADRLASAGVDQLAARQFFANAEDQLPTLDTLARRFRDPDSDFDLDELAEASIFGSAAQGRRIRRLRAAESALFTDQLGAISTDDAFRTVGISAE